MTRLRAFAIHLTASVAIFLAFLGIMFFAWYPAPYFEIDGSWRVLSILAGAYVVLGPLLTLIVFKPGKSSLKFDTSCIVLVQLGALIYGGMIIYQQRPALAVFGVDRFTTVSAAAVDFTQLKYPELKRAVSVGPVLANARPPGDREARQKLMFDVVLGGEKDIEFRPELYEPYKPDMQQLRSRGIDLARITALNTEAKKAVDEFIAKQGGRLEDYLYMPLRGKNKDIVMVLSSRDGMPVSSISISPWLEDYQTKIGTN